MLGVSRPRLLGEDIAIGLDLYKIIEQHRVSFEETQNEILLRLLEGSRSASIASETGEGWTSLGVTLPHRSELKMTYNGVTYTGKLLNGKWHVNGDVFYSPSGAARGVARTKKGKPVSLDGWKYWYVKFPGSDDFVKISSLIKGK